MCVKMMHNKPHLRMYSNIKWQISTMQKPQLHLYQPNTWIVSFNPPTTLKIMIVIILNNILNKESEV